MCQLDRRTQALRREKGAAESPGEGKRECLHRDKQERKEGVSWNRVSFATSACSLLRVFDGAKLEKRLCKPIITTANTF